jgi:hypothetical protein
LGAENHVPTDGLNPKVEIINGKTNNMYKDTQEYSATGAYGHKTNTRTDTIIEMSERNADGSNGAS